MIPLRFFLASVLVLVVSACWTQESKEKTIVQVGGPCQGCEAIHEYGDHLLSSVDTLPDFDINTPKIKLTGTVYHIDGTSPAANVIIYAYQTNREGIYQSKPSAKGWANRHGYIRGWTKTNEDGQYTFYTFRPGAYPNQNAPEHIHLTVLEPGKSEYYIDNVVFDDDPLLSKEERHSFSNRGGSGIVTLAPQNDLLVAHRDIILGKNIPDYPK